jgi:hypothetical protein
VLRGCPSPQSVPASVREPEPSLSLLLYVSLEDLSCGRTSTAGEAPIPSKLMRRSADRGVVARLDPRVAGNGWGKAILKSLPPARRTGSLAEVTRFFAEDPREVVEPAG